MQLNHVLTDPCKAQHPVVVKETPASTGPEASAGADAVHSQPWEAKVMLQTLSPQARLGCAVAETGGTMPWPSPAPPKSFSITGVQPVTVPCVQCSHQVPQAIQTLPQDGFIHPIPGKYYLAFL